MASLSEMALSRQSRRQVPSMPMMQTPYPRLNVTRSGPLLSSAIAVICHVSSTSHHSDLRRHGTAGRNLRRRGTRPVRSIETAPFRKRLEGIGQPDHGFRSTQHQKSVSLGDPGEPVENVDLGVLVEIDQHVPAENDVEDPELGKVVQQVQLAVLDHGANVRIDLPEFSGLLEIFDEHLNRQAALHLELAVDSRFGFLENLLRKVGGEDFEPPA